MGERLNCRAVADSAGMVVLALGEETTGANTRHQCGRGAAAKGRQTTDNAVGWDKLRSAMSLNPLRLLGEFRFWWGNRRSALATVKLIEEQEIEPRTLIDMGANNSQWAQYLQERWPEMQIHSFEPNLKCRPLGEHHRVALGSIACTVGFDACDKQGHVVQNRDRKDRATTEVVRFDDYWANHLLPRPAILKIDCENFTEAALRGCGKRLNEFSIVHLEMMNTRDEPQFLNRQAAIFSMMIDAGFIRCECVDAVVWPSAVHYYDLVFIR